MWKTFYKINLRKKLSFVFFWILTIFSVCFLSIVSYGQESVQLQLTINNSFSASGIFDTGAMVMVGNDWYTSNLVQMYLNSNSGSQYQITWDISSFVFGSWNSAYNVQENVYLTWSDWVKIVYLQFYRIWSGGYYIEKIDSGPFTFVLDATVPLKVNLQSPWNNSIVSNIVHFQWSVAVDTWVGFLEYTYSFSSDPTFATINYAWTTNDNWVIFNVDSVLWNWTFYWKVSSEDKLWNIVDSDVYSFVVNESSSSDTSISGGGFSVREYTIPFDDCPNWDYSNSYYDNDCGVKWEDIYDRKHDVFGLKDELIRAYDYAYKYWITTKYPYEEADMTWQLLRKHLAKMMSQFAVNVMEMEPNVNTGCVFDDIDDISEEFQYYTVLSCQLGIMWLTYDGYPAPSFNPNDPVKRNHFATTLSRLIFGNAFNGNSQNWYVDHMRALKRANVMNYISNPQMLELRWYIMLMLMRTDENGYIELWNNSFLRGFVDEKISV